MLNAAAIFALVNKKEDSEENGLLMSPALGMDDYKESGEASIDLRLGCWFLTSRLNKMHLLDVVKAPDQPLNVQGISKHYIPFGQQFILHPGSFVLAATLEWIKLPNNLAGLVSGKSSWGRRGLVIETAPGVHPGFGGCLTLELANVGEVPIAIYPGLRIAQVFLFKVNSHHLSSSHSAFSGKRQPAYSLIKPDGPALALMGLTR
jgi:dCTP deaminase